MLVGRSFAVANQSIASAARGLASLEDKVEALLGTYGVAGVSAAVLAPDGSGGAVVRPVVGGLASRARREPVAPGTLFQIASLSKPVATAFAIDFFEARGACFETATVNGLLAACGSPFRLRSAAGAPRAWAEAVTLAQLVDHSALGMHYVPGVPRSAPFPDALALVSGSDAAPAPHGYASLDVDRAPGTRFAYSGGFLVLQHLLEAASSARAESLDGWLAAGGGAVDVTFRHEPPAAAAVADGHDDAGTPCPGGRLNFRRAAARGSRAASAPGSATSRPRTAGPAARAP
ncbi:beta-lactamase [Aureococcus anophagefferens]|nr:beta-lactamase [Aureococcus anophagefferens]